MPDIIKKYVDPTTGGYSDSLVDAPKMAFTTMHFWYAQYPDVILECSLDEDIRSLVMNLLIPGRSADMLNALNNGLFAYLGSLLPDSVNVGVETADDGLCIAIPDFSACPMLQAETLAASVLARALAVLEKMEDKKRPS